MRIDKFLKVSRIIKRRTVAQEACGSGRIEVNGREAKPSKDIGEGDIVTVRFGDKRVKFRVLKTVETAGKTAADEMYEIIED